jgi:predicted phage replisome organizer
MAEGKRYFWLKLYDDFFGSKRIKKLRKMAGGDTYTIIYLKLQLIAMKTNGVIKWTGLEDTFADELALDIDEAPENVQVTLAYLLGCGLAETSDNISFFFPYSVSNVGTEGSSAKRVREHREKQKLLQCNASVTQVKQIRNGEKEKEKELEKELDVEVEVGTDSIEESDLTTTSSQLETMGGTLGQGVLRLTKKQNESLLETLSFDEYNYYLKRLSDYIIIHPDYTIKSHYKKILEWVEQDRRCDNETN